MAVSDYSSTPADNTAISGLTVTNATLADALDDIIRQMMADTRQFYDQASFKTDLVGLILPFASAAAPDGWLVADGSEVLRSEFPELFARTQTIWGIGDGTTTFNIPDARDGYLRGASSSHAVGAYLTDQNKSHSHTVNPPSTVTSTGGSHTHTNVPLRSNDSDRGVGNGSLFSIDQVGITTAAGAHNHTIDIAEFDSGIEGGAEARPAGPVVLYCVKY